MKDVYVISYALFDTERVQGEENMKMYDRDMFIKAVWVTVPGDCPNACFKARFEADTSKPSVITICGLGFFKLFINGQRVGDDELAPVTSFYHEPEELYCREAFGEQLNSRIYVERYDISAYVRDGVNEIGVIIGLGWYYQFGKAPVLIFETVNGENVYSSGEGVLWAPGPVTSADFKRYEHLDYSRAVFDDNDMATDGYTPCVPAEIPETEYYISRCPNDRIIRSVIPTVIKKTDDYTVYDVGENITGIYVFKCPQAGKLIEAVCGEEIDGEREPAESYIHGQISDFVTDGSDREYRLLHNWAAFRYLKLTAGAELQRVDVIHTDVRVTSAFNCGNEVLNRLYESFIRTQLCNMHAGIPSDCPHLERRGYTGDGQLVCETAMLTLDARSFYEKWMEDIADCQDNISGHVQYTAPYQHCGGGPGGWGCAIAVVPYVYYRQYGDIGPMKKYYDRALHYLDYLEHHSEHGLVMSDQPGLWCLGDWCTPHEIHGEGPKIPEPFVNTYFFIRTADILLATARITGHENMIGTLEEMRARRVRALETAYFDEETGNFADDLNGANAFALDIGLGNDKTFTECVRHAREDTPDFGIFGLEVFTRVLCERGFTDEAIAILARREYPSFGYMFDSGATTLWEEWKAPRSMSHPMFGSVVKLLFQYILGIRQCTGSAGMTDIEIRPMVNDTTGDAVGYVETGLGRITVRTDRKNGKYTVSLPDGTRIEKSLTECTKCTKSLNK